MLGGSTRVYLVSALRGQLFEHILDLLLGGFSHGKWIEKEVEQGMVEERKRKRSVHKKMPLSKKKKGAVSATGRSDQKSQNAHHAHHAHTALLHRSIGALLTELLAQNPSAWELGT